MSTEEPKPRRARDILNALLMLGVMVPPALMVGYLRTSCVMDAQSEALDRVCDSYLNHPFIFLNMLFFVVVDLGYWVIYLIQGSTWLIDPHWQFIPMMIACYWFSHPMADSAHPRALATFVLIMVWGCRLLHNYFRRERWHFGRYEDWRYAEMRRDHGAWWVISQFGAVNLAQHLMLVGLTMPLQTAMTRTLPFQVGPFQPSAFNALDVVALCTCLTGICIGWVSDNQLWNYMQIPRDRKPIVLETGLWRYSRHPNHFGEQTWWIGLLLFGIATGCPVWPICFGVCFNHPLDTFVTLRLIEKRMLRREERRVAFTEYMQRTSLIIPMPPKPKTEYLLSENRQ